MPLRDVLGLTVEAREQWADLAVFQGTKTRNWALLRGFGHIAALLVALWLFADRTHWLFFALAGLALTANLAASLKLVQGQSRLSQTNAIVADVRHQIMLSCLAGVTWAGALFWFGYSAAPADFLALFAVVLTLTTASAMNDTAPPLTTIGFTLLAMIGAAVGFLLQRELPLLLAPLVVSAVVVIGTINKTRALLSARLASRHLAETSDTVSLLLREFQENEADWLWQIDPMRRLRGISPRFAFALGSTPDKAEGQPLMQLISEGAPDEHSLNDGLRDLANRLKRRESFSNIAVQVTIGGQRRWWELSGTPTYDDRQVYTGFRGVGSDITERRESDEKIAYLARYDMLTRLPNRLLLTETLASALSSAAQWRSRCALLMLDLDRFKAVNDSLGHQTGDKLLAQVAGRLQSICGEMGVPGRLGGDEFGIVVTSLEDRSQAEKLANLIIERLTEPYLVDGQTLYVGTSVGSALGPRDGATVEELMRNADLALYQAKDQGGGTYCEYEPSLHKVAEERRNLEVALRTALERNEMQVIFQPVVDANREHVVSFEALLRWQSGEHGAISPAKFIPLAEDTRQIIPIGEWVLRQSCLEAMRWPSHIMVNVNVSPAQLLEPAFMPMLRQTLASTGLDPRRLEVEVTESVFMSDPTVARAALEQVMELGCSIALDDFGTGYSSLGYLRTMRFSTIKVDRLFVQGAAQGNRESLAIIRAVVAMTQSLGMTTTAEGVENADEALLIRSLGCTKIQGYHFGRPMAADKARSLLATKQAALYASARAS
ncbi:bifunctional diguanylate cyclase/phosphodiesterase [Porphyrobacter sp. GA68]|uniref:putative bifunctional diguanylate cyclase/phosphodiesterase n=1 Tax=Porphyrobacter sp. GA68 TaxID=2883480 RepID=UPI001D18AD21|nr:EAL domain-containing protein [Porphyrobacter sp. GA68]